MTRNNTSFENVNLYVGFGSFTNIIRVIHSERIQCFRFSASDKPDLGLEELSSLNVKSRFQVFEKAGEEDKKNTLDKSPSSVNVKRSASILSKLAK